MQEFKEQYALPPRVVVPKPPRVEHPNDSPPTLPAPHPYNTRSQATPIVAAAVMLPTPNNTPTANIFDQPQAYRGMYRPFAHMVIDPVTGKAMEYCQLINRPATKDTWLRSLANEFGHLAQGVGGKCMERIRSRSSPSAKFQKDAPSPMQDLCAS